MRALARLAGEDAGGRKVIATENEPSKAAAARENWAEAGVSDLIELREGDLLQTLAKDLPTVDVLLLDSESPRGL
jgi:predicted O-methyltransferase YrrM